MLAVNKISQIRQRIRKIPRVKLGYFPTPLDLAENISRELGINLFIKREDVGSLGFHGNYARITEFTIGDAIAKKADIVIHGAVSQSNHCRVIAAAAAKYNLECYLAMRNDKKAHLALGNLLLSKLVGAKIRFYDAEVGEELNAKKEELAEELKIKYPNKKIYLFKSPRIGGLGTIAMLECALETIEQMQKQRKNIDKVFLSSVGSNYAGFLMAKNYLDLDFDIISVPPINWDINKIVSESIDEACKRLELRIDYDATQIISLSEYLGRGYGDVTPKCKKAIEYFARKEGLLFEPVYTGKIAAALIDQCKNKTIRKGSNIVFLHSGGSPLLFAYSKEIGDTP